MDGARQLADRRRGARLWLRHPGERRRRGAARLVDPLGSRRAAIRRCDEPRCLFAIEAVDRRRDAAPGDRRDFLAVERRARSGGLVGAALAARWHRRRGELTGVSPRTAQDPQLIAGELRLSRLLLFEPIDHLAHRREAVTVLVLLR